MNVTLTLSYQLWLPGERLQGQLVLPPNWGGGVLYCLRGCALPHQQPHTTALSQTHGLRPLVSERSFLFELRGGRSSSRNREKRWVGERRGLCVDEWVQKIENKLWQYKYVVVSKTVVTVTHQVRTIATTVTVADAITDNVNARSAKIVRSGVECPVHVAEITDPEPTVSGGTTCEGVGAAKLQEREYRISYRQQRTKAHAQFHKTCPEIIIMPWSITALMLIDWLPYVFHANSF